MALLEIDQFLATSIAEDAPWPASWTQPAAKTVLIERALYHGIAGLLIENEDRLPGWPTDVVSRFRNQALAQAMWELRHKVVVSQLLTKLADQDIVAIILKGTALAYDLYETPATRARGDSDILVERRDLQRTREILAELGFRKNSLSIDTSDEHNLQEVWELTSTDGTTHIVDLHWQVMNCLALRDTLSFADCAAELRPLPRLCAAAVTMGRTAALMHACMHRAAHFVSPYIVDGKTYQGGDRLIWAVDIDRLANALTESDWDRLCVDAVERGVGPVCLDGLIFAQARLGTAIPANAAKALSVAGPNGGASTYLLHSGQARRALEELKAVPGISGKAKYLLRRVLPPANFMRARYSEMAGRPLFLLYAWRLTELMRKRPT